MILYTDTSSLVKLYLEEAHSDLVREWVAAAEAVATSRVALPEALSAFARRHRRGELTGDAFDLVREAVETDWQHLVLLPIGERRAGELAVAHGLRGFDAIHLAAALDFAQGQLADTILFSSFDSELLQAARAEGMSSLVP